MAVPPDAGKPYPLLEEPLWNDAQNGYENNGRQHYLRILEIDIPNRRYTDRSAQYP